MGVYLSFTHMLSLASVMFPISGIPLFSCMCDLSRTMEWTSATHLSFQEEEVRAGDPPKVKDSPMCRWHSTLIPIDWNQPVLGKKCCFAWLYSLHTYFPWEPCRKRWLVNGTYSWLDCSWILFPNITKISAEYLQTALTSSIVTAITGLTFCIYSKALIKRTSDQAEGSWGCRAELLLICALIVVCPMSYISQRNRVAST